jgi:hypothetical protein
MLSENHKLCTGADARAKMLINLLSKEFEVCLLVVNIDALSIRRLFGQVYGIEMNRFMEP